MTILEHLADRLSWLPALEPDGPPDGFVPGGRIWQDVGPLRVDFPFNHRSQHSHALAGCQRIGRLALLGWHSDSRTLLRFDEPAEKYVLWIPTSDHLNLCDATGMTTHQVAPGSIGITHMSSEIQCVLAANARFLALIVPQAALTDGLSTLSGHQVSGRVIFDENVVSIEEGTGKQLLQMIDLSASMLANGDGANILPIRSRIEDLLILSMLTGLPHSFTDVMLRHDFGTVPGTVALAEAYIRSHASDPITVEDIARAAGCGVRALQISFRRFRKTTPMAYLRRVRLELIYDELVRPKSDTTVAGVAAAWYFPHPARLAAKFRQAYGETPHDVLKRGRRR